MRSLFLALTVLAIFQMAWPAPTRAALDAKAVKKAVEDYVDADATEARRANLLGVLGKARNADVAAGLKSQIRKDANRERALELALLLHVRGQFAAFEKYFEEHPAKIAELGLITADKGAAKTLQKRWLAAPPDSPEFGVLNDAFLKYGVDFDAMAEFQKVLADDKATEERKAAAGQILQFQLGLDTADPTEINLGWERLKKDFNDHGERPALTGMDWLAMDGWVIQSARRCGPNLRLTGQEKLVGLIRKQEGFPESIKSYGYTVTVRARLEAGFNGDVGLWTTNGAQSGITGAEIADGFWYVPGRKDSAKVAVKPGEWVTVSLVVKPTSDAGSVNIAVSVDGQVLVSVGILKATPVGFCIQCLEGKSTWGSVDYVRD